MTNTARQSSLFHRTGFLQLSYPFISKTIWLSLKLLINQGRHTFVYWHSRFRMRPTEISFNIFFPFRSGILPYKFSCIVSLAEQVHMNLCGTPNISRDCWSTKSRMQYLLAKYSLVTEAIIQGSKKSYTNWWKALDQWKMKFKKKKKRHLKWHTSLPGRQHSHW